MFWDFDTDVGGLNGGNRQHSRFQTQFVGGFTTHEGNHAMRAHLNFDLGHDGVAHNPRHDPGEPVTR